MTTNTRSNSIDNSRRDEDPASIHRATGSDIEYGSISQDEPSNSSTSSSSKQIRIIRTSDKTQLSESYTFVVGQKVVAHWKDCQNEGQNLGTWLPATVSYLHSDGSLDIVRKYYVRCSLAKLFTDNSCSYFCRSTKMESLK